MTAPEPEPQPLGPLLQTRMAALGQLHRAVPEALDPDDDDLTDTAADREQWMQARWQRTVPQRFHAAMLGECPPQVQQWAHERAPGNLVLLGPVGTGKTHCAVAACRPAFDRGLEVRFYPVVELLDLLRPGGPDGALYDLADVDRLVLDDVGAERPTDWTAERLFALLNRRWLECRPTIVTSNLPGSERTRPTGYNGLTLEGALGERMFSRLVGGATVVRLAGPDRRRAPS